MARDAVLLDEILENMNASVLPADQYGSSEFRDGESPLVTAVQNGDLASVKVLMPYSVDTDVQEGLFFTAANGNTDILRCFIENEADIEPMWLLQMPVALQLFTMLVNGMALQGF